MIKLKLIKSILTLLFISVITATCFAVEPHPAHIRIGTMAGPETELVEVAKDLAKKHYHLDVEIIQFTDYLQPNAALEDGSIDVNMFQHVPFLEQQIKARGYHIMSIAKTFIFPMAIYSKKHTNLNHVPNGAMIAIPNDPTNEGRALLLLESAGLIQLKEGANYHAMPKDIVVNQHNLQFIELEGPQLPRTLQDVDYAVINNTFAYSAGLNPQSESVYTESTDSPYANIVAVKIGHEHDEPVTNLIRCLQSQAVLDKAKFLFKNTAVATWQQS